MKVGANLLLHIEYHSYELGFGLCQLWLINNYTKYKNGVKTLLSLIMSFVGLAFVLVGGLISV